MVRIRLARHGTHKKPFYRIVAADREARRDGRFLEIVGTYNPLVPWEDPHRVSLKESRINYWLGVGAQPSDTVESILKRTGFYDRREKGEIAMPAAAGGAAGADGFASSGTPTETEEAGAEEAPAEG